MPAEYVKIPDRVEDITGQIIGKNKVLEFIETRKHNGSNRSNAYWLVECTNCGTQRELSTSGINRVLGCKHCPKPHPSIPGNGIAKSQLFRNYRNGASQRKIEFYLTKEQFLNITTKECYYCGRPPSKIVKPNNGFAGDQSPERFYEYNGVDRLDSSEPYTLDNCVPCCEQCNKAKLDYSVDEFLSWVKLVYEHQGGASFRQNT